MVPGPLVLHATRFPGQRALGADKATGLSSVDAGEISTPAREVVRNLLATRKVNKVLNGIMRNEGDLPGQIL